MSDHRHIIECKEGPVSVRGDVDVGKAGCELVVCAAITCVVNGKFKKGDGRKIFAAFRNLAKQIKEARDAAK